MNPSGRDPKFEGVQAPRRKRKASTEHSALSWRDRRAVSRAVSLAVAYDYLKTLRSAGHGYPTLSFGMLAVIHSEAEDRGEIMDSTPDGTLALACIKTIDEAIALACIVFTKDQRACIVAEAIGSLEEHVASPEGATK